MPDQFPRATGYLNALPKEALMRWLTESDIGKKALSARELKWTAADKSPMAGRVESRGGRRARCDRGSPMSLRKPGGDLMKRTNRLVLAIVLICFAATHARAAETSHLVFATEYVRELSATENAREAATRDLIAASTLNDKLSSAIYRSTRIQSELRGQIKILSNMRLDTQFDGLIQHIVAFYQHKIDLYQTIIDYSGELLVGPKTVAESNKITTETPRIRAFLDDIDQALFNDVTPLVFATLIHQRPDSHNHLNHLNITKEERSTLLKYIATAFGNKLEQKDHNYTVGSAALMRDYLLKDYKCADDPWQ